MTCLKSIRGKRKGIHRKLFNSTFENNQAAKKNKPDEMANTKGKRGEFDQNNFVYFAGKDDIGAFNDYIDTNRRKGKDKIPIEIIYHSKKLWLLIN